MRLSKWSDHYRNYQFTNQKPQRNLLFLNWQLQPVTSTQMCGRAGCFGPAMNLSVRAHYQEIGKLGFMTKSVLSRQLNLPETLAMSVALMAPSTGMVFVTSFLAAAAGYAVPLAFAASLAGVLIIGFSFGRLSKLYSHAGSAYGLCKDVLGQTAAAFAGWGLTLTYVLLSAALLAGTGEFAQLAIKQVTGINLPWGILAVVTSLIVFGFAMNNIRLSMRTMLILEGVSMLLIALVSALIIGHSHLSAKTAFKPFTLGKHGVIGIAQAMVFGLTSFLGFEGSAVLGEESNNPKKMVPLSIIVAALVGGIFFMFVSYAQTVGFGLTPHDVNNFAIAATPLNTLTQQYLGNTFTAMVNIGATISFFSCALASVNGSARMLFALSRDGYAAKKLSELHDESSTPRTAVYFVSALALALLGLGTVWFQTPSNVLGDLSGMGTFGALVAYGLVIIASLVAYWRNDLQTHKWFLLALPVVGLAIIGYIVYGSVYPAPPAPVSYFPYIVLGYFAIVMTYSLTLRKRHISLRDQITGSVSAESPTGIR